MEAEKIVSSLNDSIKSLQDLMHQHKGLEGITETTRNMLPKDAFEAELDGHRINVSIAVSGTAIILKFSDDIKCASVYNEIKQNKQGFFKRIFRK